MSKDLACGACNQVLYINKGHVSDLYFYTSVIELGKRSLDVVRPHRLQYEER